MNQIKIKMVKEWFKKADNDLLNIENNLKAEKIHTDTVCFNAQQTLEKYLKGFLLYNDVEFEFVYDLDYLLKLAKKIDSRLESIKKEISSYCT